MKILDRYIGITVAIHVSIALLVLIALATFTVLLAELDDIGRGNYNMPEGILYILLTTPLRIYEYFPLAALIGSITGLGSLSSGSELTVIRAAGVSLNRIVFSVLKTGVILMVIVIILGELVAPHSEQFAQNRRHMLMSGQITFQTKYGFWARDGLNYINIRKIGVGGVIGDIYIHEFDDKHQLRVATHAKSAVYLEDKWLLEDITRSFISDAGIRSERINQAEWESLLSPSLLSVVIVNPDDLSAWNLYQFISYLESNGQTADRYRVAFWKKVFSPMATLLMIFLSVPFVFGGLRSVSIGQRITVGVMAGVAFHLINETFSNLGLAYNLSPFISVTIPLMIFLTLGIVMMRKIF